MWFREGGMHYHRKKDCMFVDDDYQEITLQEAKLRNLRLCPNCVINRRKYLTNE